MPAATEREKKIVKHLRDKLVQEIDRIGLELLEYGHASDASSLDAIFDVYKRLVYDRTVSLDVLLGIEAAWDKSK